MKSRIYLLPLAVSILAVHVSPLGAQVVADGATNTLSNVTNTITGDVIVGTNGSFTLLVLSDNALLTNSGSGTIGFNTTAKSNEVRLVSPTARWQMGGTFFNVGSNSAFNRLVVSNGATVQDSFVILGRNVSASNNLALVTGSGSVWTNGLGFWLGLDGAGNQLVVSNGGILRNDNNSGDIGLNPTGSNNLAVVTGSGSTWINANASDFYVGLGGAGNQLLVSNGGNVRSGHGYVGANPTATNNLALITGAGSVWTNALDLEVGAFSANNQMMVSNGATVSAAGHSFVGSGTNANGNSVMLTDPGTHWLVTSNLYVGSNGAFSLLVVSNGALVANNNTILGNGAISTNNSALVTGNGSVWSNRFDLTVGFSGPGNQLALSDGAAAYVGRDSLIGVNSAANSNSVTVTDLGTSWLVGSNLLVGSNGAFNRLVISNGGLVENWFSALGYSATSSNNEGVLTGAGSMWRCAASLYAGLGGAGNRLTITNGGKARSLYGGVGVNDGSSNNLANVTGPGSVWSNSLDFFLGASGSGNQLVVSNGALVVSSNGFLGVNTCSNNLAVVTGTGSGWTNANDLYIGRLGSANRLVASNGASVFVNSNSYIGFFASGSSNVAVVTGAGSLWTNGLELFVGDVGSGNQMVVSNGAGVWSQTGNVGYDLSSNNVVIVTGPGSFWNLQQAINNFMTIGGAGNGNRLEINNGGSVRSYAATLGLATESSNNEAVVTGSGSFWTNSAEFLVGLDGGRSRLVVSNSGLLAIGGELDVGNAFGVPSAINHRVTVDGGTLRVSNPAGTALVDIERGTNVLKSGLIDVDKLLLTNTQGFFEFNGGTLITRGAIMSNNLALDKTLVVGASGAAPGIWDARAGPTDHILSLYLYLGENSSFNQLLVTNGALFTNSFPFTAGVNPGANSNAVTISGAGSRCSLLGINIGSGGSFNALAVSNGALLASSAAQLGISPASSNNQAVITGAGSVWSNLGTLYVGEFGKSNQLLVSDGGRVVSTTADVGAFDTGSNNVAWVTGPGSIWNTLDTLSIGDNGRRNQLQVTNGGLVTAANSVLIGVFNTSSNNRVVVDNSTLLVTNASATGKLDVRRGIFTLNSGLVEVDQLLVTNSLGSFVLNGGTLSSRSTTMSSGNFLNVGNNVGSATFLLAGNGTHVFGSLEIDANSFLIGNGTVGGAVVLDNGGTISPGTSIGKMIFTNSPFLFGTILMEISKSGATLTNDQLQVTTSLHYNGVLTVTNIGPAALAAGDKFTLFSATSFSGSFNSIAFPPLGPGLSWTNKLLVDGSIEVFAPAAIPLSTLSSGSYTQNFDSLAMSGGGNFWRNNSTLLGWYAAQSNAPTAITNYIASDGSLNQGALYSFGSAGSSDRALGSIATVGTADISYGLCLTNDTANSVSNFTITYTGEQWRNAGGSPNTLTFWYRVAPFALTNPEPGVVNNWTEVTNLDFVSPTRRTSAADPLDGNVSTNRQVFSMVLVPGLAVPRGQTVFFRWDDTSDATHHGMAVDDLIVSFARVSPQITSVSLNPTNGFLQLTGQGESNLTYGIEAASNLNSPIFWQRIGSNTANSTGLFQLTDTNAPGFPMRFYRALFP